MCYITLLIYFIECSYSIIWSGLISFRNCFPSFLLPHSQQQKMLSQTRIKSTKIGDRNTKDKWPLHKVDKHQFQKTSLKTIILNRVKQNSFRMYLSFAVNESLVSLWKRQYCFEYLLNKNSSHLLKSFFKRSIRVWGLKFNLFQWAWSWKIPKSKRTE